MTGSSAGFFLLRLNPPRASFPMHMTVEETAAMQEHFAYWSRLSDQGIAIAYGPVNDPKGTWGVAIVRVRDGAEARGITADDPAIRANLGFAYDIFAMPQVLVSGAR